MNDFHEIAGAIHIHTRDSDGSEEVPIISQWAEELGLDFLLFSDHHTLKPRNDGLEGFYGNVLSLIGYETSDHLDHNHYLIFQTDEIAPGLKAPEYVKSARLAGGLGIIAHPIEKREALSDYPPYPWTHWELKDFDGIEIWNQLSEWTERLTRYNRLYRFLHPLKSLVAPSPEVLNKWDQIAAERRIIGIAGVDAHCFRVKLLKLFRVRIFHYKVTFRSLRNHILLEEPFARGDLDKARQQIYSHLRKARLFFSNPRRGDARGFKFWGETGDQVVPLGDEIQSKEIVFKTESPLEGEIYLLRNGEIIASGGGKYLEYKTDKSGVYRVEIKRRGKAWIFSNHIYLR